MGIKRVGSNNRDGEDKRERTDKEEDGLLPCPPISYSLFPMPFFRINLVYPF